MLPDFPKVKAELNRRLMAYYNHELRRHTIEVPYFSQHEGDRSILQREDGTIADFTPEEASVVIEIPKDQLPGMTLADAKRIYTEAADRMAGQFMGSFFRVMNEAVEEAGTTVDARGEVSLTSTCSWRLWARCNGNSMKEANRFH